MQDCCSPCQQGKLILDMQEQAAIPEGALRLEHGGASLSNTDRTGLLFSDCCACKQLTSFVTTSPVRPMISGFDTTRRLSNRSLGSSSLHQR